MSFVATLVAVELAALSGTNWLWEKKKNKSDTEEKKIVKGRVKSELKELVEEELGKTLWSELLAASVFNKILYYVFCSPLGWSSQNSV